MATPFHRSGELDIAVFCKSLEFMQRIGVDGVTICGVLGESNRLVDNEREMMIRAATNEVDIPVVVGTSHAGTYACTYLSQMAEELGASGVMVSPSKENVPLTDDAMVRHFQSIAAGIKIPIVLQDHPASTSVHMTLELLNRLIVEVPQIKCLKLESLPTASRLIALRGRLDQNGRDVSVLAGLGALYGYFDIKAGIDGFMTGFAFPEILMGMLAARHDDDRLFALYRRYLPLTVFEQQPGVALRKEALRLRGLYTEGVVRSPGAPIAPLGAKVMSDVITRVVGPGIDITQPLPHTLFEHE